MPVLYNLTLQRTTAIPQAVYGNFSAPRAHEILVSRGNLLELLRPDDLGKLHCILSTECFGIIRSIATFRLTGATRDCIVMCSDSGRLVILDYNAEKNKFDRLHCETYGKTGVRRVIPGEYLAVDPKGRALMIAAVERQKFVYILNRDSSANITISSPLEAHKSHMICHALSGVDMGFENPMFTSIEQNYEVAEGQDETTIPAKTVSFWEMDLGLNHVVKKASVSVSITAHLIIPVPGGGTEGPSGVIACCEDFMVYKKLDHDDVYCSFPRRLEMGQDKGILIVSWAVHKMKDFFFILVQSEYGDIYKVEIAHEDGIVREMTCRYFDTIPVANSICVLKSGYLFVASEFGNHMFYQFTGIGRDDTDPMSTSSHPLGKDAIIAFKPRGLKNLLLCDEMHSLSPITDMKILDAQSAGYPQLYALCGRGPRSSLRILQHGLSVEEMADNELPGRPRAVWTVKENTASEYDGYIIVASEGSTLVLSIGDTVEEVAETSFLTDVTTLHVALLFEDSYIQIHEGGIRHILRKRVHEWKVPAGKRIKVATSNDRQIVISLSGGELIQFEVDETHNMVEIGQKNLNVETTCMAVQPVPEGRLRGSFVAVGGLDNVVRLLSLDRDRNLRLLTSQVLPNNATAESVCLVQMKGLGQSEDLSTLFLNVGLNTGVMLRSSVDPIGGQLADQRTRFLGGRAVKFHLVQIEKSPALLALSEKSWLYYTFQGKFSSVPLNYDPLEYVASFCSEQCTDGFVAIANNSLRIFRCHRLGEVFSQTVIPLSYTPRKLTPLQHPSTLLQNGATTNGVVDGSEKMPMIAIVEADHNTYDEATKAEIKNALKKIKLNTDEDDMDTEKEEEDLPEDQIGTFKAGQGKWGSCIRVVNPMLAKTVFKLALSGDEAALSCCACEMLGKPLLIVGTTSHMTLLPHHVSVASIKVFTYDDDFQLSLLHSTPVEDRPTCFAPYNGRLLAAVGNKIRIYALGKKKLLLKCEYRNLPESVTWLRVRGDRIFVADVRESFHVLKYREQENILHVLCDDTCPRWVIAGELLDYHTIIGADKFDSIFILRVPAEAKQDEVSDMSGLKLKGDTAYLTGKCYKMERIAQFHLGDIVMGMQKSTLVPGGAECIVYATILGAIGAFVPFLSKEELDFFHHLEMIMRSEQVSLCGREHIMFRSYYHPVQNVVDGNLCEQFITLPLDVQKRIAADLDKKSSSEILKKLEEIRNRVL